MAHSRSYLFYYFTATKMQKFAAHSAVLTGVPAQLPRCTRHVKVIR